MRSQQNFWNLVLGIWNLKLHNLLRNKLRNLLGNFHLSVKQKIGMRNVRSVFYHPQSKDFLFDKTLLKFFDNPLFLLQLYPFFLLIFWLNLH